MQKIILISSLLILMAGCASKKNGMFTRAGDRLEVSTCTKCKGQPFYVDGRWIANGKK